MLRVVSPGFAVVPPSQIMHPVDVGCSQNSSGLLPQEFTPFLVQIKNPEMPLKGRKRKGLFKGAQNSAAPTFQGYTKLLRSILDSETTTCPQSVLPRWKWSISALSYTVATSHMELLSPENVASVTKELIFKFYLIPSNLNLKSHMWLVGAILSSSKMWGNLVNSSNPLSEQSV